MTLHRCRGDVIFTSCACRVSINVLFPIYKKALQVQDPGGGRVARRCCVSYVTRASKRYWLTVGQGLLSLLKVRIEGNVFISSVSLLSFLFLFLPCPTISSLYYLFYLFSPFLWETTQNDTQGLACRQSPTQSKCMIHFVNGLIFDFTPKNRKF